MPYSPYTPTWNNPYATSNPYGQSQYQPTAQPMTYQQPVNGVIKVNGRESALQYQLPPNSTSPALFDNNGEVFYIISTDGTGTKTIECFDFSPHVEQPVKIDGAQFVSRQEFDEFTAKVNAAIGAINNGVHGPVQQTSAGNASQGANGTASLDAPRGLVGDDGKPHAN